MKKRIIAAITMSMLLVGCGEFSVKDADLSELRSEITTTVASTNAATAAKEKTTEASAATDDVAEKPAEEKKPAEKTDVSADTQSEAVPSPVEVQADNTASDPQPSADTAFRDPFAGNFYESKVGRGMMTITNIGDATYNVKVSWPGTASGEMIYEVSGQFNGRGVMHYSGCVKKYRMTTDNINFTEEIEYSDGTGYFMASNDGENEGIIWHSDKEEDACDGFWFIRS